MAELFKGEVGSLLRCRAFVGPSFPQGPSTQVFDVPDLKYYPRYGLLGTWVLWVGFMFMFMVVLHGGRRMPT